MTTRGASSRARRGAGPARAPAIGAEGGAARGSNAPRRRATDSVAPTARRWLLVGALAVGSACEAADPGEEPPLQPLEEGRFWRYESSRADGTATTTKTVRVRGEELVDDGRAWRLETARAEGRTDVWLAEREGWILRVREERRSGADVLERKRFTPGSLRTPATRASVAPGDLLQADYVEEALAADGAVLGRVAVETAWRVEAIDEPVRTPAGEFRAVRLRREGGDTGEGKLVWYAPGVGKVREQGGRIEVLVEYGTEAR